MKKIRAAVVGYGNIGKYVVEALEAAADFEIAERIPPSMHVLRSRYPDPSP